MKTRLRPFIKQVQQLPQTLYNRLSHKPSPISNPQLLQTRAEALAWEPVLTLEQQEEDESWVNSTPPKGEVLVRVLSKPPHISDMDTIAEMPALNVQKVMSHILDEPDTFAAIANELLTPGVKDKTLIPRIPTAELQAPEHITYELRKGNITDPYLSSVRMTPQEFAIVPRQRSTAQLPPRLGDDTADSVEHVMPVGELINGAIVTFHQEHQRLPHGITVSLIRFYQHWLDHHYSLFTYKTEYGNVQIPIRAGAKGELLTNEVRLD